MKFRLFGLMIGLVVLATLMSCQPKTDGASTSTEGTTAASSGKIVFIYVDTLTSKYESLQEKSKAIEARVMEAEKTQGERIAAFQRDAHRRQNPHRGLYARVVSY